jgi:xanthine dehydrogenase accessory factor
MTHNYNYDLALLGQLITQNCAYIGVLGPKKKLQRMLDDLGSDGIVPGEKQLALIHGPVGLDIGAETAEEIAVSIVAEISTVLHRRSGASLKDKQHGIHSPLSH